MNNVQCVFRISTLALIMASGAALANSDSTRDTVRTQPVAASQAGESPIGGPATAPANAFYWVRPQAPSSAPAKTRAQVRAELIAARRNGELPVGEPEIAPRDAFPWMYPTIATSVPTRTREEVRAEARAAVQAGKIPVGFLGRSAAELFPGAYAQNKALPSLAHSSASTHAN